MFYILSFKPCFQNSVCALPLWHAFQMLESHTWLVATVWGVQCRLEVGLVGYQIAHSLAQPCIPDIFAFHMGSRKREDRTGCWRLYALMMVLSFTSICMAEERLQKRSTIILIGHTIPIHHTPTPPPPCEAWLSGHSSFAKRKGFTHNHSPHTHGPGPLL